MEYQFIKHYHEEDVNTTFSYPFNIDEDYESIELFITIWQKEKPQGQRKDLVGVGLRNKGIVRAWNCTNKTHMVLGKEFGTPGTVPGDLEKGLWEVIVFPRTKNKIEYIKAEIRVKVNTKELRFVKGDPHIHTLHSDGKHTIEENARDAWKLGLDYIFIADHNIPSANISIPKDQGILVGPGVEYGLEAGHALLLGVDRPIDDFTWDPQWGCYEGHLEEARKKGAYIGINHPFWEDTSWDVGFHLDHDWVEIWNGVWRPHNEKALNWWHDQLCKGKQIPVVGGSDFHQRGGHTQGMPTTHAEVNQLAVRDIVEAYKKGHVFITADPQGPTLSFTAKDKRMGEVSSTREVEIEIAIPIITENLNLSIITDKDTQITSLTEHKVYIKRRLVDAKFARIEIRDDRKMVLLSNPIYFNTTD